MPSYEDEIKIINKVRDRLRIITGFIRLDHSHEYYAEAIIKDVRDHDAAINQKEQSENENA